MFASGTTKLENMVDPEVMAPMITAKISEKIAASCAKARRSLTKSPPRIINKSDWKLRTSAELVPVARRI